METFRHWTKTNKTFDPVHSENPVAHDNDEPCQKGLIVGWHHSTTPSPLFARTNTGWVRGSGASTVRNRSLTAGIRSHVARGVASACAT